MDTDIEPLQKKVASNIKIKPFDEVDFTSGYETQYQKEYGRPKPSYKPTTDRKSAPAWYRDFATILMVIFLTAIFIIGTVFLVMQVITTNPIKIMIITGSYVIIAAFIIYLEVKSIHVR